jgi:hypothetical protein
VQDKDVLPQAFYIHISACRGLAFYIHISTCRGLLDMSKSYINITIDGNIQYLVIYLRFG